MFIWTLDHLIVALFLSSIIIFILGMYIWLIIKDAFYKIWSKFRSEKMK